MVGAQLEAVMKSMQKTIMYIGSYILFVVSL